MAKQDDFLNSKTVKCSFCGKTHDQVRRIVAGPACISATSAYFYARRSWPTTST
jgi:hypothetical protein